MLKWSLLLMSFLLLINCAFAYHPINKVTIYGDDAYPPYSYAEGNQVKGIYADILAAAFERMPKYQVTMVPLPWRRGLKMLEVGEGFALFPPYFYTERRPYISPYSEPILAEEVVVMCRPEAVINRDIDTWPQGYYGLTVGVNQSYALGGQAFWQAVEQGDIQLKEAKSNRASMINLYKQRIDCYMNDRLSILWELKLLKNSQQVERDWSPVITTTVSSEYGYLGYARDPDNRFHFKQDFVTQFNQALNEIKRDGTIDAILANYRLDSK
ncbi:amino acid ABC transporter substrate-binding protein [Vibrio sp. JPW-9-11-11]|uniref:substrate-binding periplasmic protein n=1 Tax=Vibrio sp. JPW-9-11-11 TaxID=1416532 RepID=UPI001594411D|nr:transporter substrate-binding domain-containing protein [Vibrio sp. JPW-9-11-11]NVD08010.1 amino acid ABC transporter substrate-binding protein [Vibrio sp. JPW-9-11-11]